MEVEYAAGLNKRFVTVLHQGSIQPNLHPELAKVQWIDFNQNDRDFNANFNQLVRTLDTDREHLRIIRNGVSDRFRMEQKKKTKDLLLRGSELAVAEVWLQGDSSAKETARRDGLTKGVYCQKWRT